MGVFAIVLSAGTPAFDYYELNLSWSPEFCYSSPGNPECSGHFGFIVHGLWPQSRNGRWPEHCGQEASPSNPQQMLDIMPDLRLIEHEWEAHGTCSGLAAGDYFSLIRRVYRSLRIPPAFVHPYRQFNIEPAEIKRQFEEVNPGLTGDDIRISCRGPYLTALEVCFTKDGRPTQCSGLRDCQAPVVRVPRVQ